MATFSEKLRLHFSARLQKLDINGCGLFSLFKLKGFCHRDFADFWPKLSEICGSQLSPFKTLSLNT